MIDKTILKEKIKEKNYSKCIIILFNEIKNTLVTQIKEKNPNYSYITIGDLKNKSLKYLSSDLQSYAIILYTLTINPEDSEIYELNLLLAIYEELISKKLIAA